MTLRVATDVGGTFTDLVAHDLVTGAVTATKVPSTPRRPSDGVLGAVDAAAIDLGTVGTFLHGCTVVINAITERKGARTALVTTRGFRDVLEIGRGNRPDMYDLRYRKPAPLVPRRHRFELTERVAADGAVVVAPVLQELEPVAAACRRDGIEAVAVCLLHAYAHPAHEHAVRDALAPLLPGVAISVSSDISRQWREYERTSTVVLNGYVQPVVEQYLTALEEEVGRRGLQGELLIMQSSGGTTSLPRARAMPITLVESGPAAGIIGAREVGRRIGEPDMLYLDIGGTTAKCTLIRDGEPAHTTDYRLERTPRSAGIPVAVPVVDIVEIGAGGGSIAALDDGGALQVGPRSAGAVPGPACYGLGGTDPTVTDALLVAGVLDPEYYLGGRVRVDRGAALAALGRLGRALGLQPEEVATGVIRLADAKMINALRIVSVHRGNDPRDFTLVASGGGGPVHAASLGAELRVKRIVIPPLPGYFSAWGMLVAEPRVDLLRTDVGALETLAGDGLRERFAVMEREALELLGRPNRPVAHRHGLELRYRGQEHGVWVTLPRPDLPEADLRAAFHAAHERRYTFALPDDAVEVVTLRLGATVRTERPPAAPAVAARGNARKGERAVDLGGEGPRSYTVLDRERLGAGFTAEGPLLVEEPSSTTVVRPGQQLAVDPLGHLLITATG